MPRIKIKFPQPHPFEVAMAPYRILFDSDIVAMAVSDSRIDFPILDANKRFLQMVGYTRRDLENGELTWAALTPQKYDDLDDHKVSELFGERTIEPFEKEYLHKKGFTVPVMVGSTLIDEARGLNLSFAIDLSEQKRSEQKKDELIGFIRHELKTPLAVLKIQAELLRQDISRKASERTLLQGISDFEEQIDHMNLILQDILNIGQFSARESHSHWLVFDLRQTVKSAVEAIRLVSKRDIRLTLDKKKCEVHGSETKLRQVVNNLIGNAIKYSPTHSPIEVSVLSQSKEIRFAVKDYGRGIKREERKKIFHKSYRVRHPEGYRTDSSGIGLYLSSEIMKEHGGRIEVKSRMGKGSTFYCILPLAKENGK